MVERNQTNEMIYKHPDGTYSINAMVLNSKELWELKSEIECCLLEEISDEEWIKSGMMRN